jgi:hypothetical protein
VMENDLDSVMQSASRPDRRDVDDTAALKSVVDCRIHKATNRTEYLRIPRHVGTIASLTDRPTRPYVMPIWEGWRCAQPLIS